MSLWGSILVSTSVLVFGSLAIRRFIRGKKRAVDVTLLVLAVAVWITGLIQVWQSTIHRGEAKGPSLAFVIFLMIAVSRLNLGSRGNPSE